QVMTVTEPTVFPGGSPGIGFFLHPEVGGCSGLNTAYGFSHFLAQDLAPAPPDPTVPTFNAAIHTSFFFWNADTFASTAAMLAAASFVQQQRGTLALDPTNGPTGGKCGRVDWGAAGCGSDGDVQVQYTGLGTVPRTVILLSHAFKTSTNYAAAQSCGPDQKQL